MARKDRKPTQVPDDAKVERALRSAIRSLGWSVPETESEVEASEADFVRESIELPAELEDAMASLAKGVSHRPRRLRVSDDNGYQSEYRRAARDLKGPITSEAEEQMKRDREAAERAQDKKSK